MKSSVLLINTARGGILDETILYDALKKKNSRFCCQFDGRRTSSQKQSVTSFKKCFV
ncbi:NAD(P)-dependent oxidoreductase [Maribacter sp. ACAM166]|uniref:NAD(P)-dependent oxidoreductase n=1 Tax=Maribacter sp. ACAM166 TaxID=2508996 RepID=UPI0010FD008F|nr:hypothetical protein ES765_13880 [Maribacter sp. ACAM166]